MKKSWCYLILFITVILLLCLALLNPGPFLTYLIEPIARILWWVFRMFLMVDQVVYWVLFILAALITGLSLIPGRQEHLYRSAYPPPPPVEDRVAYWEALLQSAEDDPSARLALQRELENLKRSIEAQVNGNGQPEQIILPPVKVGVQHQIRALFNQSFFIRLMRHRYNRLDHELGKSVKRVLDTIEMNLEINHERSSSNPNDD